MTRIMGVDPGSRLTGYGCVDLSEKQIKHVTHGTLHLLKLTPSMPTDEGVALEKRLLGIYEGLTKVILNFRPEILVVEKVFFAKNAVSSLKLGQARGAVLLTGALHGLTVIEYAPTEVKASVVGYGRADKDQVAKMVNLLVGRQTFGTADASDALALAICHAQRLVQDKGAGASRSNHSRSVRKRGLSLADAVAHAAKQKVP